MILETRSRATLWSCFFSESEHVCLVSYTTSTSASIYPSSFSSWRSTHWTTFLHPKSLWRISRSGYCFANTPLFATVFNHNYTHHCGCTVCVTSHFNLGTWIDEILRHSVELDIGQKASMEDWRIGSAWNRKTKTYRLKTSFRTDEEGWSSWREKIPSRDSRKEINRVGGFISFIPEFLTHIHIISSLHVGKSCLKNINADPSHLSLSRHLHSCRSLSL